MSNFNIFDYKHLELLLEPFAPGMTDRVTPIKYETLTPDSFLFLFRATAKNNEHHYFVSLETDFQTSLEGARRTIEDWHGNEVIDFWPLGNRRLKEKSDEIDGYKSPTSGPYFAMLAEVKRPTNKGYWAESVTILPGDNIGDKIKGYPEKMRVNIRKTLARVLRPKVDPNTSSLDSLHEKKQGTTTDDINQTGMTVSIYVQPDGGVEFFG